jgi:hypothetical protein
MLVVQRDRSEQAVHATGCCVVDLLPLLAEGDTYLVLALETGPPIGAGSAPFSTLGFLLCLRLFQRSLHALEQYTALLLRRTMGCLHSRHTPMNITPPPLVASVESYTRI